MDHPLELRPGAIIPITINPNTYFQIPATWTAQAAGVRQDDAQAEMAGPAPMAQDQTYERQRSLITPPQHVCIVGVGGVGSWLAYFLGLAGVQQLTLWDHDVVDVHNLNRLPLTPTAVGKPKAEAIRDLIVAARPECRVLAMDRFDPETADAMNLGGSLDWIVATTDTLASRKMVESWAHAADHYCGYLEAAAEGEFGSVTGKSATFATEDETAPGYASVPVWVGPCVYAASMCAAYILHDWRMGREIIRLGWEDEQRMQGGFKAQFSGFLPLEVAEDEQEAGTHDRDNCNDPDCEICHD